MAQTDKQTDRQTDRQTDIATLWLNWLIRANLVKIIYYVIVRESERGRDT